MSILAGPADARHVRQITSHLKRTAQFAFKQTILVIDTMRPSESAELTSVAAEMCRAGEIDEVIKLGPALELACGKRHFLRVPMRSRDIRGIPMFGWIAGIESISTEYLFHADCDVLIHSKPGFSWIAEAIACLNRDESVMFVQPHPGPPSQNGIFHHPPYVIDAAGNYRFKSFSSRHYVLDRSRFRRLLPLPPIHYSTRHKIRMRFGGPSSLMPWESHVEASLQRSPYYRIHFGEQRAWGLHCPDHSQVWRSNLPKIIREVEAGHFPIQQAGHYDLRLDAWLPMLAQTTGKTNRLTDVA